MPDWSPKTDPVPGPNRDGMGALIILVLIVLGILGLMGFSSYFQSSGTGRTYNRVVGIRSTLEVADSAIVEAFTEVRLSVAQNTTFAQCPDNWRVLILGAVQNPGSLPTGKTVVPLLTKQLPSTAGTYTLSNVTVDVVSVAPATPSNPVPSGVLQFSVTVQGNQKIMAVQKTVRQRRAFFLYASPAPKGSPPHTLSPSNALVKLLLDPLATVIE